MAGELKAADFFDPEQYTRRVNRARQAWSELMRGERQTLVFMNLCAPFLCDLFGVELSRYYTDLRVMAETQLKGIAWRLENLDEDEIPLAVFLDQATVHEAVAFNLPIAIRPGSTPWGGHLITDLHEADELPPPDFVRKEALLQTQRRKTELASIVEGLPVWTSVHLHAPFTMAAQLFNSQDLCVACYDDPERVARLLEYCVSAFLAFERVKWQYGISPEPLDEFVCWREAQLGRTRIWVSDDTAPLLSPKLYEQFVLPYNRALFGDFQYVHLHMDGRWTHLVRQVGSFHPDFCEVGGETDWTAAVDALGPSTILQGGILGELARQGSSEECAGAAREALLAAKGKARMVLTVANEVHPGTPLENLQAIIQTARETSA